MDPHIISLQKPKEGRSVFAVFEAINILESSGLGFRLRRFPG